MLCLLVGGGAGLAIGIAVDAVKAIAAEVSPVALGLFAAAFLSALLISLVKKNNAAVKHIGKLATLIFSVFFITQVIPIPAGSNGDFAHALLRILPWAAVAAGFVALALSFAAPPKARA